MRGSARTAQGSWKPRPEPAEEDVLRPLARRSEARRLIRRSAVSGLLENDACLGNGDCFSALVLGRQLDDDETLARLARVLLADHTLAGVYPLKPGPDPGFVRGADARAKGLSGAKSQAQDQKEVQHKAAGQ